MNGIFESGPLDAADLNLLSDILSLYEALDPTPAMLPDLVLFGLSAVDLDAELARLVLTESAAPALAGVRAVEHARRVTFTSDNLTVMIAVQDHGDGSVRLDGWSAPGGGLRAELRTGQQLLSADCDVAGRFVFDSVPTGMAQLTLHPTDVSDPTVRVPVVTPAINL